MNYRPGQASVHYGDLRGEAAADFFADVDSKTDIQDLARELGWEGKGRVVGMSIKVVERKYEKTTLHCFWLTLQITDEYNIKKLKDNINDSGGNLPVREHTIRNIDILDIVKHFKRFEIGLFTKSLNPIRIEVIERSDHQ